MEANNLILSTLKEQQSDLEDGATKYCSVITKEKLSELIRFINSLSRDKETAERRVHGYDEEVTTQKKMVSEYRAKCEELQETLKCLEKQLDEQNRIHENETDTLREKLNKSEQLLKTFQDEYKIVVEKHSRLRESLEFVLTSINELVLDNDSAMSNQPLTEFWAHFNEKLERTELNRKALRVELEEVRKNTAILSSTVTQFVHRNESTTSKTLYLSTSLKGKTKEFYHQKRNVQSSKAFDCKSCGKSLSSWKKLQVHQRSIHVVQKSKEFLQRKYSSRVKLTLKKLEDVTFTNITTSRMPASFAKSSTSHGVDMSKQNVGHFCLCGHKARNKYYLKRHINYYTAERKFSCQICGMRFIRNKEMYRHLRRKHKIKNLGQNISLVECAICGRRFRNRSNFLKHRSVFHWPQPVRQELSPESKTPASSTKASKVKTPLSSTTNDTPKPTVKVKLSQNRQKFIGTCQVTAVRSQHARSLQRKKGFYCVCGKQSPNKDALIKHIRYFTSKCHFRCSQCKLCFPGFNYLRKHTRLKHGLDCPGFGCRACGKILDNQVDLRKHQQAEGCQNRWGKKANVATRPIQVTPTLELSPTSSFFVMTKQHAVDRFKRRGFYCRCGSRHSSANALSEHIRYFTSEKNFVCQICSKRFVYHCKLKRHMVQSHKRGENTKDNETCGCSNCGKCFASLKESWEHRMNINSSCVLTKQAESLPSEAKTISPPALSTVKKEHFKPIFSSVAIPSLYSTSSVFPTSKDHGLDCSNEPNKLSCKCGIQFGNKGSVDAHVRFFGFDRAFSCLYCDQLFSGLREKNAHVREAHHVEPDPEHVGCPSCGVVFSNKPEYRRHMIMKMDDRNKFLSRCCPMTLFGH